MLRAWLISAIVLGIVHTTSGQGIFVTNTPVAGNPKSLYLKFENTGFFKNNEFKSSLADGYTLTGNWIRPKLVYLASEKISLELGWHYLHFNGAENATHSLPWFSARIGFLKNWQLTIGNLNNSRNHGLISPVWEPERFLTDKPEAGLQILHNSKWLTFDGWLNWEQFINEGNPFQEHFTTGLSANLSLINKGKIKISLPFQALLHHRGGEIDTSPESVQTLVNTATGLKTEISLNGFFQQAALSAFYTTFNDQKGNNSLPFDKGNGFFSSGSVSANIGRLGLEYWHSEKFFAIKGMELLQVVPDIYPGHDFGSLKKEMIQVFYDVEKEFSEGVLLGVRLEGWFEPETNFFSNSAAVYIIINQDFLLKQF